MATAQPSERRARYAEALLFWALTLVVCAGAGYGSYRYGRSWIGDRLGDDVKPVLTSEQLASRVTPEAFERTSPDEESDATEEPPKEAEIEVHAASLDEADKAKLEAEKSGAKATAEPDESAGPEGSADTEDAEADSERPAEREQPPRTADKPRGGADEEAEGSGRYVVRAGAFKDRANAERVRDELRRQGYSPYLTTVVKDNVEFTRVNVGSYPKKDEALRLRGELQSAGYSEAGVATE